MPSTALDILRLCAASPWLGDRALRFGNATGGSTTTVVDTALATFGGDQRLKGHFVFFPSGSNAGTERYVSSVDMSNGTLSWVQTVSNAVASGDQYVLLRDSPFAKWLDWMNETARSLHYTKEVYLRGITSQVRYTLPTPLSYGGWIEAVFVGPYPFRFSEDYPRRTRWHRLNPANVEGDLHLVLAASIDAGEQILFLARPPFLHPEYSAYTMTRSVLVPFGETATANPPARLIAAGTIWRALREKFGNLTGDASVQWGRNLEMAARAYAQGLAEFGVKAVAADIMSYSEDW